ncbi:MAG: acetylglutamate kinase [Methanobrevibacter thaueri]|jgi:acetylglutamate kinase|uniref:Acetylglutamate kinase n=1 Tax=Methanobrevibacter thaueri TaxID=190975 RepID=A0A8T3V5Y3_9EURY|nr:acetylglutamate kinase [Methanobrevibacter thaueri]MBE6502012.1 acetylglutamate kinase [Methanobrevibacter thaueri]
MKDIDVLIEALPYIKKFHGEKILIKYGGHAMVDEEAKSSTARDTVLLKYVGMKPLIVHGGGPEISRSMEKLGKESKFIKGLRVTDEETMEIIEMVLVGKISTEIVSELIKHDGQAISLSGKDSSLIFAHKTEAKKIDEELVDLGLVGEVDCINTELLDMFLENDYIPVISPVGIAKDGTSLNLNADTAAGEVASAVGAEKLIILTDVPGVLRDPSDPDSLIQKIRISEVPKLIEDGIISGGMIPKIETCVQAIEDGVKSCHIIDGRKKHSLLLEIFTDEGIGTMIFK